MTKAIDYWCNPFTPEIMDVYVQDEEIGNVIKWWGMEERWVGRSVNEFVNMMDDCDVDIVMLPSSQMRSYQRKNPCGRC